ATRTVSTKAVELQGATLVIGGTTGGDTIVVAPSDRVGNLNVTINGTSQGNFNPGSQLVVYGQAGNDIIQLATSRIQNKTVTVGVPAVLYGDDGNDTLDASGSTANNVLLGGAGAATPH